jgi:CDP-diacylglycerol--serine O-phosphatidyltransferase
VKMVYIFAYLHPGAIWIIAAVFPACAAMRLARFNAETDEDDDHMHFSGLPSPAAAASIAGFAILFYTTRIASQEPGKEWLAELDRVLQYILPFFTLLVAALMVSRIPYPHIVNQVFRGQRSFGHLVALVFALAAVMLVRGYAVAILCVLFVLVPPIKYLWQRLHQPATESEPLF